MRVQFRVLLILYLVVIHLSRVVYELSHCLKDHEITTDEENKVEPDCDRASLKSAKAAESWDLGVRRMIGGRVLVRRMEEG